MSLLLNMEIEVMNLHFWLKFLLDPNAFPTAANYEKIIGWTFLL